MVIVVKAHVEKGITRKRVGIKIGGKIIAREGAKIFQSEKEVGVVTSGCFGPSVGSAVVLVMLILIVQKKELLWN